MAAKKRNHYEVLEISNDAKLIDIKKAYRRLALKHHPDRNNGSAESTERFKEISEAYAVLSDTSSRINYDASLRCTTSSVSTKTSRPSNVSAQTGQQPTPTPTPPRQYDAFKQFDNLFRNDPFFHEAFQDMDDAFAKRFDNTHDQHRDDANSGANETVGPLFFCGAAPDRPNKVPWSHWIMNKLGIELSVSSYSHKSDGSVVASTYTTNKTGTYTNKKSRKFMENGKQVSIISMEKDGNKIEDKFVEGKLVERRVNGEIEDLPRAVAN